MNKYFYRFRKLNSHTIDELKNSYCYCAETNELNDPMEGFHHLTFRGDCIVWQNLFRHYFTCLLRVCLLNVVSNCSNSIDLENEFKSNDFIFGNNDDVVAKMAKTMPCNEFLGYCEPIIRMLSNRKNEITKNELSLYLFSAHIYALNLMRICNISLDRSENIYKGLAKLNEIKDKSNFSNLAFEEFISVLTTMINTQKLKINTLSKNERFILLDFVDIYLQELNKLIYPRHYIISFTDNPYNSSMWANYAGEHSGICLIFESKDNDIELTQLCFKQYQNFNCKFRKVKYDLTHQKLEFFSTLWRYTLPDLVELWYKDNNNISPIFSTSDRFYNDSKKDEYWDNAAKCVLNKSKDWEYEKEFRLIISSGVNDRLEEKKLFYNFNSLNGIIFGINTTNTAKLEIINLIQEKCKNSGRGNFQFYQAYYCERNDNIGYEKLF